MSKEVRSTSIVDKKTGKTFDKASILKQLKEIVSDPAKCSELDMEQIAKVKAAINPLGVVVDKKDESCINVSVINFREKYYRQLYLTAVIGYMFRVLTEYEDPDCSSGKNAKNRKIIRKFLDRNFKFNPDHHVRSAVKESSDIDRKKLIDSAKETAKQFNMQTAGLDTNKLPQWQKDLILNTYQMCQESIKALTAAVKTVSVIAGVLDKACGQCTDPNATKLLASCADQSDDLHGILLKHHTKSISAAADLRKAASPLLEKDLNAAYESNPPADVYLHLNRYLSNHYEELREIVEHLYTEQPDLETAVVYYGTFDNEQAAAEYKLKHREEFKSDVLTLTKGTHLLGPFKENRDRVDFYNKNTEIIKLMIENHEKEQMLAADIVQKKAKTQKAKNVIESGPDNPEIGKYISAMGTIDLLTNKDRALTKEEQEQLAAAKYTKEQCEVPDNMIQVDVFTTNVNEEGQQQFTRDKFYTQAEAPEHLAAADSVYKDQYQPNKQE